MSNLSQIEEIYHAALEKTAHDREVFLNGSCGDNVELRREVESLLKFDEQAADFIETPPEDLAAALFEKGAKQELVGKTLGHYRVLSLLGAGGMGEVYLAEDVRLDRKIALKILPPEFAADEARMGRFVREAKSASALNHPNIITIYEIGEIDANHFIAAEYIEGETLLQRLKKQPFDLITALDISVQVASALDTAHRAGIVHRDVKPENIMVRPDGLAKVLDFGIAKLTEERPGEAATRRRGEEDNSLISASPRLSVSASQQTNPGTVIGTATYMSPEQAKGMRIDARSDIFSFGIVLYEMFALRRAFDGETPLEIISSILKDEPPPIQELPPEIDRIVRKMLRKNRDERYQTADVLLTDLKNARRVAEFSGAALPHAAKAPTSVPALQMSSAEYIMTEVKKHKSGLAAISLALIALIGTGFWFFNLRAASQNAPENSIAVLPFQNVNGDQNTEFLSDGIAETLINNFTKSGALRVTARSTAFRYRGRDSEPQTIGAELGVGVILTGKVWQIGEGLSIQVDLVNAADGTQIWGDKYDGKAADILEIQQKIARDVTGHLRLTPPEQQQAAKKDTEISEAYKFYLRGRYHWNKRTAEDLKKAIQEFKQAADLDPNYAPAFVGLADCYILLEEYAGTPATETLPEAKAFATRALEIDESLGEAHVSLGVINSQMWQWEAAEYHFTWAIQLNPKYPIAYLWFCTYLRDTERLDEALAAIKQAQSLDPLSSIINVNVGMMHLAKGDADSAFEQLEDVIELDPNYWTARSWLGLALLKQGRNSEALAQLQKGVELSRGANRALAFLGYGKAVTGNRAEALAIVKELEEKYAGQEATILNIAAVYAGLGDKDQSFEWLEKNLESRSGESARIRWYPPFELLRGDPRYQSLLRRMGQQP